MEGTTSGMERDGIERDGTDTAGAGGAALGDAMADLEAVEAGYDRRPAYDQRLRIRVNLRVKHAVQGVVRAALGILGPLGDAHLVPRRPLRAGDPAIRRILIIRVDLIGDLVLSLPAVRALRRGYPDARIDLLVLPSSMGVLAGEAGDVNVVTYDPNIWRHPLSLLSPNAWRRAFALIARLRAEHYDLCVSVSGDWASVLARVSGARRRVGYAGEAYPSFMTHPVPGGRYRIRQHEAVYALAVARAAGGIVDPGAELPSLRVAPEAARSVGQLLARHGLAGPDEVAETIGSPPTGDPTAANGGDHTNAHATADGHAAIGTPGAANGQAATDSHAAANGHAAPLVILHAGAQNGQAKRWPAAHWATLADELVDRLGARVALTGSPGDAPVTAAIRRRAHHPITDLAGATALAELVALLARADLVISGDSGPLHIACAVGTPVVGLYGPTDPAISGPVAPDAIVLRRPIWCAPCYDPGATADCRFGNPICMKDLAPRVVFAAARRQLARSRPDRAMARLPMAAMSANTGAHHVRRTTPGAGTRG
jgi:ADP-heptose:LPS heptosyltransferase